MANSKRYFRPKAAGVKGTPYDSMTEKRLHEGAFKGLPHHTETIHYTIQHRYEPDFIYKTEDGLEFILEVKGFAQDASELQKIKNIKNQLRDDQIFVMVLEKPDVKLHWYKVRKDGTKMSLSEWCDKNKIMWVSEANAGKILDN